MTPASAPRRHFKWGIVILVLVAVLGGLVVAGLHIAARTVKEAVLEALGPESRLADVRVGFASVILSDLQVPAPKSWPTSSALNADRVVVEPDIRQLFSDRIHVNAVIVERAYLAAVRPKEGGGLKVLPSVKRRAESSGRPAFVEVIEFRDCTVELYDATVSSKHKLRVEAVVGTISDLAFPGLDGRSAVDLKGIIRGRAHKGTIAVAGWVDVAKKSSEMATSVRDMDLTVFEPYLVQKTKVGLASGSFNLDLKSSVVNNVVRAPGKLLITGLKFRKGEGLLAGLASIPQRAIVGALADENDRIAVSFELKGSLDDPEFSLTEGLGVKTGSSILGLGFEALVRAFFLLVNGLGSAVVGG